MSSTLTTQALNTQAVSTKAVTTRALATSLPAATAARTLGTAATAVTARRDSAQVCVETTNLMPAVSMDRKWTISHVPAKGLDFGLTKVYRQRPTSHPPG